MTPAFANNLVNKFLRVWLAHTSEVNLEFGFKMVRLNAAGGVHMVYVVS